MKLTSMLCALGAFITLNAWAAELRPMIEQGNISAVLVDASFPDVLAKDLRSGLENTVLIDVVARSSSQVLGRRSEAVIVKYDLWEETFKLRRSAGSNVQILMLKDVQDVLAYLKRLVLHDVCPASAVTPGQALQLEVQLLVNPVDRERMERLRQWVAANSTPSDGVGGAPNGPLTSRPNDLFNRIFDQYTRGDDLAAPWKFAISSGAFTLQTLQQGSSHE